MKHMIHFLLTVLIFSACTEYKENSNLEEYKKNPEGISETCGNGTLDTGEACEREEKINCEDIDQKYKPGMTNCLYDCTDWELSECVEKELSPLCGNGDLDEGEECDRANNATRECVDLGSQYEPGQTSCTDDCRWDRGQCNERQTVNKGVININFFTNTIFQPGETPQPDMKNHFFGKLGPDHSAQTIIPVSNSAESITKMIDRGGTKFVLIEEQYINFEAMQISPAIVMFLKADRLKPNANLNILDPQEPLNAQLFVVKKNPGDNKIECIYAAGVGMINVQQAENLNQTSGMLELTGTEINLFYPENVDNIGNFVDHPDYPFPDAVPACNIDEICVPGQRRVNPEETCQTNGFAVFECDTNGHGWFNNGDCHNPTGAF